MGAADAHQHTDSNRNDNGSHVVHGTLKAELGLANHRQTLLFIPVIITVRQTKKEVRGDFQKSFLLKRNNGVYVLDEILNGFE